MPITDQRGYKPSSVSLARHHFIDRPVDEGIETFASGSSMSPDQFPALRCHADLRFNELCDVLLVRTRLGFCEAFVCTALLGCHILPPSGACDSCFLGGILSYPC